MSGTRADIARRALDALRRADRTETAVHFDPDAVWRNTSAFPGPRSCSGPDAIVSFWAGLMEVFDEAGRDVERTLEDGDRVILELHLWGQGVVSGAPVDERFAIAFLMRGDRIVEAQVHGSFAKAIAELAA